MRLPKVLILGQPFNDFTGGGITLSNLFFGWDKQQLAVACVGHLMRSVDTTICDNYYQLGKKEHKWIFPFNFIQRKFSSGPLQFESNKAPQQRLPGNEVRSGLVDRFFYPFLKQVGLFHRMSVIKPSKEFFQWVDDFKPDILYVQVSTRKDFSFTQSIYSYLKIPLVIHVMDDWPSTISNTGILKKYWFRKIDTEFRALLDRASLLMSISDQMSEEYEQRYHKKFISFHNPVDIDRWKPFQKNDVKLNGVPSFLYAGRIGIGIDSSLMSIARAIQSLSGELRMELKFILQTKEKAAWFDDFSCVDHRSYQPYAEVPRSLSQSDFLVLPYDFSEEATQYIKFSMPTKVSEYMISGVPILIFAPENTALVRFAKKMNIAIIVTDNNITSLCNTIKESIQNENTRMAFSRNAIQVAEEKFDSQKIRMNFKNAINALLLNQVYL